MEGQVCHRRHGKRDMVPSSGRRRQGLPDRKLYRQQQGRYQQQRQIERKQPKGAAQEIGRIGFRLALHQHRDDEAGKQDEDVDSKLRGVDQQRVPAKCLHDMSGNHPPGHEAAKAVQRPDLGVVVPGNHRRGGLHMPSQPAIALLRSWPSGSITAPSPMPVCGRVTGNDHHMPRSSPGTAPLCTAGLLKPRGIRQAQFPRREKTRISDTCAIPFAIC